MSNTAERLKAAQERDEAGIDQDDPAEPTFEAPENPTEPEPTPGEPEPEPEPAPEPEPEAGGMSAEQAADLEKAMAAYFKRVEKVFGADNVPPACPTCEGLGFDLTGGAGEPEWHEASWTEQCDQCFGEGGVLSGSKLPDQRVIRCDRCKGAGYLVTRPVPIENPDQVAPVVVALAEGGADNGQATSLTPNDPGWEPWMGNAPT